MNDESRPIYAHNNTEQGSLGLYVGGFIASIALTLIPFALVEIHVNSRHDTFTHPFLITVMTIAALLQFFVQLYCFLHLGRETRPRWKLLVLFFMITVVFIVVFGSLWIMNNLNYRMTPQQMNSYMQQQDGGL